MPDRAALGLTDVRGDLKGGLIAAEEVGAVAFEVLEIERLGVGGKVP